MKPSAKKLQGGGKSPLTALKGLCQRQPATLDKIMDWAADEKNTNAMIRQRIGDSFHVQLSRDGQLSSFYSWVRLVRRTQERDAKVAFDIEKYRTENPDCSDAEMFQVGQRMFSDLTIAEEDPSAWVKIQKELREREELILNREKFQFDAAKLALSAVARLKTISASKLSDGEKIDAARRALFGELPETPEAGK